MKRSLMLLAFCALPLFAQEPYKENVDVNVVQIDATVTDRAGHQILGLTKDDFVVKENGVEKKVDSVDYFTNRRLLTSPESQAAFKVERVKQERYFIIMFHRFPDAGFYRNFYYDLLDAKRAASQFIDRDMLPEDRVAIVSYDVRLKLFSDFTGDKKQLKSALDEAVSFSMGIRTKPKEVAPDSILAHMSTTEMINHTGTVYEGLQLLADAVKPIAARKVLILFSPGIGGPSSFNVNIPDQEDFRYKPMMRALNSANVTVYSINLLKDVNFNAAEHMLGRIADETGGDFYSQSVSFLPQLRKIENANNGYYMITFYSEKDPAKHGFQRIDVKLKNPEFKVQARSGYSVD